MGSLQSDRHLVTEQEVEDISGKLRGLRKLFDHPRRSLPELQSTLSMLLTKMQVISSCATIPYSQEMRKHVDDELVLMKCLEDVIIRVILVGESFTDAVSRHLNQQNE
uniref:Focal_AT domain-containing protein n=1 Tax=Caenorhabditis tropicalis TaxID=1561998 RepID=A0A1I7TN61_9PELO